MILGKRVIINDILHSANSFETIARWIGASNVIRNQKIVEFVEKDFNGIGQAYAFIKKELEFLKEVPSEILRNSASSVYSDANAFSQGLCKKPKIKSRFRKRSAIITQELFSKEPIEKDKTKIIVYSANRKNREVLFYVVVNLPCECIKNQLILSRERDKITLSFSYDDGKEQLSNDTLLRDLSYLSEDELNKVTLGMDAGVVENAYLSNGRAIAFSIEQRDSLKKLTLKIKKKQRYLEKQRKRNNKNLWIKAKKKGLKSRKAIKKYIKENNNSNQQKKTKQQIAKQHRKTKHIRTNFNHHLSKEIVKLTPKLFIYESLYLKNMTKKAKPKLSEDGKTYLRNNKRQKSGLNKAILNVALGQLKTFTLYKLNKVGKAHYPTPPPYTSQRCSDCKSLNTNRVKQSLLICLDCGKKHQADHNASLNIKYNGIQELLTQPLSVKTKKKRVIRKKINKSDESEALPTLKQIE